MEGKVSMEGGVEVEVRVEESHGTVVWYPVMSYGVL